MSDDDDFLFTCEKLWTLCEEGTELLTRVIQAREASNEGAVNETADRIDLNHVKRRLLLLRVQDIAQHSA
jgi:hypothetical protein